MENCWLWPARGWMPQDAWEAMLADALHPQGAHSGQLPAYGNHLHVLRRLWEGLLAMQKEGNFLWDIIPSQPQRTNTPSAPRKP